MKRNGEEGEGEEREHTFVANNSSRYCDTQCSADWASKPCALAYFMKNALLFSKFDHESITKIKKRRRGAKEEIGLHTMCECCWVEFQFRKQVLQGFPIASFALLQYSSTGLKEESVKHERSGGKKEAKRKRK